MKKSTSTVPRVDSEALQTGVGVCTSCWQHRQQTRQLLLEDKKPRSQDENLLVNLLDVIVGGGVGGAACLHSGEPLHLMEALWFCFAG